MLKKGTIELVQIESEYQLADLFTKAFDSSRFEYLIKEIGMTNMKFEINED